MSEYELTIYADKQGPFGHFSVGVTGPDIDEPVSGKYLRDETVSGKIGAVARGAPGAVRDDSERKGKSTVIERSIPLSKKQAQKAAEYIANARADPGEYELFGKNCIDLAQGALDAADTGTRLDMVFTETELDELGRFPLYGAGDEAQRRGRIIDVDIEVKELRDAENPPFGPHAEDGDPLRIKSDGVSEASGDPGFDALAASARKKAEAIVINGNDDRRHGKGTDTGAGMIERDLDALMLKQVDDLTEDEVKALGEWSWKLPSNDRKRLELEDRRRDFYRLNYGDELSKLDETGRLIAPEPVREIPAKPKGLSTPDGEPVAGALKRMAGKLARPVADEGETSVVKALQTGLSILGEPLKVDGVSGPKTKAALKRIVTKTGVGRAEEAFGIGQFKRFTETERDTGGPASGLKSIIEEDVQPLFGTRQPMVAAETLQESLNDLNAKTARERRQPAPEPLKIDGDIGPATTDAFRSVLAEHGPEELSKSFASFLGFGD